MNLDVCVCDNADFEVDSTTPIEQEMKGITFFVKVPHMKCKNCGFRCLTDDQAKYFFKQTKEEYNKLVS